jgi:putative membrane protein
MQKIPVRLFAGLSVALTSGAALAQQPPDADWYPHMMWWGGGWYAMIFGPLFMILVLALLVAGVVILVRWAGGPWTAPPPHATPPARTPLDILRERFARGEIDKDEFEERRRVLGD